MKRFSLILVVALAAIGFTTMKGDEYDRKTVISISQPLEVPGVVLPPGTYVMKLLNSSSNRHIVQFMNERQNQQLALTFAVPAERIRPAEKTILTMYEGSQGAPPAIRTWFYPGDTVGQEFLYPHRQAVSISERTNTTVREVETARVEPAREEAAAVEPAEPVQNDVVQNETRTESLIARAEPAPEPTPAPEPQQTAAEPQTEPQTSVAQNETASAASDSLPKTASNGPLAGLLGALALVLAFGMRKVKRIRTH